MSTNPRIENPKNTNNPAQPVQTAAPAGAPQPAKTKTKAVTIQLSEETHRKLRIVALSKGATTSGLVEGYVDAAVRKDMIVALSKLSE
jgi:hypothetical protein